jgi:hypothetical protein
MTVTAAARPIALGTVTVAAAAVLRARQRRWGATDDEVNRTLPGDDLISPADLTATRAITIHATVAQSADRRLSHPHDFAAFRAPGIDQTLKGPLWCWVEWAGASGASRLMPPRWRSRRVGTRVGAWLTGARSAGAAGRRCSGGQGMDVRMRGFGAIEVDGLTYEHDIVIDGGKVRKRTKKPSKPYRDEFGHTPLSAAEELPWAGSRLIVGTGAYGSLPIMREVIEEAARRGVDLDAVPTEEACRLISGLDSREVHAVLHVTC